jgi:hypothetical protein
MEPGNAYNHLCGPTETPEGYHNVDVAGHLRSAPDLDPTAAFTRADFGRFWPSTSFTALQKCGRYRINSGQTAPSGLTGSAAFDPLQTPAKFTLQNANAIRMSEESGRAARVADCSFLNFLQQRMQ